MGANTERHEKTELNTKYVVLKLVFMKGVYYFGNQRQPWRFKKCINGKHVQRNFSTKKAAEDFARSFLAGQAAKGAEAVFFDRADKELLDEIRAICGDVNPLDAVKWWKAHWNPKMQEGATVRKAFEEFVEWLGQSGRSRGHVRNVGATGAKFCEAFGDRVPSTVQSDEILTWLLALPVSPKSKKNIRGDISSFFLWCKNAKGWVSVLPELDARLLPRVGKASVDVWTAEEAEAALRKIEREFPRCVPYFALRFFAGLRDSEARRMRWEWIDFKERTILVPGKICKTGEDWLILPQLLPDDASTVFAWLAPFREAKGALDVPGKSRGEALRKALLGGKKNVIRHTFCTMLANWNLDDAKTIWATRHTNVQTLREHYKGVNQPRAEVEKYFALRPTKAGR